MRFQPAASRIALTALALLLLSIPAFGEESAPAAEKAPETATNIADQPATGTANAPAAGPAEKPATETETAPKPATSTAGEPAEAPAQLLPHIVSFRFVGNEHFSGRFLKRNIETKAKKPVDVKVLSTDVDLIVKLYLDDGFLQATVNVTSEHLPGTTDQELLFTIIEGPRFKLKSLDITGNTVFPTEELRALAQPEKDGYFSKSAYEEGARHIWEHYGQAGRLTTVVEPQRPHLLPLEHEVTARYVITEGPPVTLQEISLQWVNAQVTEEWIVRRELARKLYGGMALTLEPVEDVIGRLKKYHWFKSVQYSFKTGATPDQAIMVVTLEEGWTSRVSVSGGAMSYSGLSATLSFEESNFDLTLPPHSWKDIADWNMFRGRGERLQLSVSPGQRFTNIGGTFEQPHTFGTDNTLLVSGLYSHEDLPDFSLWQGQVRAGLERELADHWWVSGGPTVMATELWNLDRHDVPDYNDATGYTPGYGMWGRLSYATTPENAPIINSGVQASLFLEPLYEDVSFLRTTLTAKKFFPLHGEGYEAHVLEVSGQGGQILGNAPVFERFFCGGLGSVRGFDVWGISPQYLGVPIGGFYFATGKAEYGFPIWRPIEDVYLRGVVFTDAGDSETRLGDMGRIRVASGFGLRAILTKANGLTAGINFAWPLNSYRGDDTEVFTFFMGMGF